MLPTRQDDDLAVRLQMARGEFEREPVLPTSCDHEITVALQLRGGIPEGSAIGSAGKGEDVSVDL